MRRNIEKRECLCTRNSVVAQRAYDAICSDCSAG